MVHSEPGALGTFVSTIGMTAANSGHRGDGTPGLRFAYSLLNPAIGNEPNDGDQEIERYG